MVGDLTDWQGREIGKQVNEGLTLRAAKQLAGLRVGSDLQGVEACLAGASSKSGGDCMGNTRW